MVDGSAIYLYGKNGSEADWERGKGKIFSYR